MNSLTISRKLIAVVVALAAIGRAAESGDAVSALLAQRCVKCHGGEEVNGDVDFRQFTADDELQTHPDLIQRIIDAIDANEMPPEDQPQLDANARTQLLSALKVMLRDATKGQTKRLQIRRLNRFQYNNTVKDLFQLKLDVFALPERLMTRQDAYLHPPSVRMPEVVHVASQSLRPQAGLRDVQAFPKDLPAEHGFDNQANQLTLSPLLLDAFLRLSVSIVESPDFNAENVGIWNEFFQPPASGTDFDAEVRQRLERFLSRAFRGPIDNETLDRYLAYTAAKMREGLSFTESMKKVTSAVLSSPLFLYRSSSADGREARYELASNLAYFLWASSPDEELLELAASGRLSDPDVLNATIDRMFADPKIERFLDTFPAQWMQLENVMAVTPNPEVNRYFRLDPDYPASVQLVLEPLLLFDAVFVEDRPIVELIAPAFSYRSDFLTTWYTSDLKPPEVAVAPVVEQNSRNDARRSELTAAINRIRSEWESLIGPARASLAAARAGDDRVDLYPYAAWEFNGNLRDEIRSLDLNSFGEIKFLDGMVVLQESYLLSDPLPIDLKAKTLEVWCRVPDLSHRGGGLMGIQGPGNFFDSIVLGERQPQHWISGSEQFNRTDDFPESTPETYPNQPLHLVMVYEEDGSTTLYRNGVPYGKPIRKGIATFPQNRTSVIFGLRHLPPGGNKHLSVNLDRARLYDRALTAAEVAASAAGAGFCVPAEEVLRVLTAEQRSQAAELVRSLKQAQLAFQQIPPNEDPQQLQRNAQRGFDQQMREQLRSSTFRRQPVSDPRYGGVITNAAILSMTSGPKRTHPIARGAWIVEVIFNDPPNPPPNNVPPLKEDDSSRELTIRERFAVHRQNPACTGCHARIDPLGFALENFDITGRWRDKYDNGRDVDASGTLLRKHPFDGVVDFKKLLVQNRRRFARAFTGHMLRFALSRELTPADSITIDSIVDRTEQADFKLRAVIRGVILSDSFLGSS